MRAFFNPSPCGSGSFHLLPLFSVHVRDRFDVAFALHGDLPSNSRALRQLRLLGDAGLRVRVVVAVSGAPAETEKPGIPDLLDLPGARIDTIFVAAQSGPPFFRELHRRMRRALLETPARAFHASGLYVLPAAQAAARACDARVVYDVRELYPHVPSTVGKPWARAFWSLLERRHIRRADAILTVGDAIADRLSETYGVARPAALYNIPLGKPGPLRPVPLAPDLDPGVVTILHQGNMMKARGCEELVAAMPDVEGAALVFLGGGPLRLPLAEQAAALGVAHRVRFVDPVPSDRLLEHTASADLGVTLLQDTCLNHRFALPNKLFEYLMAGLPVIASDLPEIRRVVAPHDVGVLCEPGNQSELTDALRRAVASESLRARWRRNIPRVFETFNPGSVSKRFLDIYEGLLR